MQEISPQRQIHKQKIQLMNSPHKQIDSRWVELKFTQNFTPRSYFASCIQAGNIYIHGGFNAQIGIMKDLMICCMYDTPSTWKYIQPKHSKICNPGPLRNHTLSSYKSNLVLIGGQKNVVENSQTIYRFDLLSNTWSKCKCVDQHGKAFNFGIDSHCSIVHDNHLYIIGGYQAHSTTFLQKVIQINLEKLSEDQLTFKVYDCEVGPSPRANAGCCLVDDQIYLFGGGKVDQVYNDLWIWHIKQKEWKNCQKCVQNITWPDKRKGGTLSYHKQSKNIFLFGGIKTVTKQYNDVYIWMIDKKRWIKIHSNTNDLYDPSPTVKQQLESPSISNQKRRKEKMLNYNNYGTFKIGLQSASQSDSFKKYNQTHLQYMKKDQQRGDQIATVTDFKKKMSVVQEKKYREFLNRKRKLLNNIESGYDKSKDVRSHSPTSEALIFSLNHLGQQPRNQKSDVNLPKVIYNQEKGQVLGKKPCARDGHSALVHDELMIIFGGDRHMVSFNDAYLFKLNKGVQSLPHYE